MATEHLNEAIDSMERELAVQMAQVESSRARLAKAQREMNQVAASVDELRHLIAQAKEMQAGDARKLSTTSDFILAVLRDAGEPMRDTEIMQAATDRGWITESTDPLPVFRTFLSRMIKKEIVKRTAPATYTVPTPRDVVSSLWPGGDVPDEANQ